MSDYIPKDECQRGWLYDIRSRNLALGVYDGKGGFVGIREKFGSEYLFTEYHWDNPSFATVRPIKALEKCPVGNLAESFILSKKYHAPVVHIERYPGEEYYDKAVEGRADWNPKSVIQRYYFNGEPLEADDEACWFTNQVLFNYLLGKEKELGLR